MLLKLCFAKSLNLNAIQQVLLKGANAKYFVVEKSSWGENTRRGPLQGVFKCWHWENREKAWLAIEVLKELFNGGADPNELISNSDWRQCGGSSTAFQVALTITKRIAKSCLDCGNLCSTCIEVFLDAGADVDKEMCEPICSMGTEGVIKFTILHGGLIGYPISAIRKFLPKAEVDKPKLELISSEHGADQDSCKTPLYLLCSTRFNKYREEDRFNNERKCLQIASALLEFGADPNSLNT